MQNLKVIGLKSVLLLLCFCSGTWLSASLDPRRERDSLPQKVVDETPKLYCVQALEDPRLVSPRSSKQTYDTVLAVDPMFIEAHAKRIGMDKHPDIDAIDTALVRKFTDMRRPPRFVELGVGTGRGLEKLLELDEEHGWHGIFYAVDNSEEAIRIVRERFAADIASGRVVVIEKDFLDLDLDRDFGGQRIDVATLLFTTFFLVNMQDKTRLLSTTRKYLNEPGIASIFVDGLTQFPGGEIDFGGDRGQLIQAPFFVGEDLITHQNAHLLSPDDVENMAEGLGFVVNTYPYQSQPEKGEAMDRVMLELLLSDPPEQTKTQSRHQGQEQGGSHQNRQ